MEQVINTQEKELLVAFTSAKVKLEVLTREKSDAEKQFDTAKYALIDYLAA